MNSLLQKGKKTVKLFFAAAAAALLLMGTVWAAGNTPEAVSGSKGVNSKEGFENLFDGSIGTKWCVRGENPYVIFRLNAPASITGYTLVTGNDTKQYPGRNPKSWRLYGCNPSSQPDAYYEGWNLISTVVNDTVMEGKNTKAYYFGLDQAAPAYQYYLFWVDDKNSLMQLSELILEYPGGSQVLQSAEDGSKGVNGTEGFGNVTDGKASTKWCTSSVNPWVVIEMSSPTSAIGYHLVTGNDNSQYPGRNPRSWRVYGSNSSDLPDPYDSSWVLLDTITNDSTMQDVNGTDFYFELSQPSAAYRYYLLWVDEKESAIMQLSEIAVAYEGSSFGYTGLDNGTSSGSSSSGTKVGLLCGSCAGRGSNHCFVCQGSGMSGSHICSNCGGTGQVKCMACNGTGYVP